MNDDKFHNKNGSLTMYAFACGYIEQFKLQPRETKHGMFDYETSLSAANIETGLWDIKGSVGNLYEFMHFWVQAEGLKNARRLYSKSRALLRKVHNGKITVDEYIAKMEAAEKANNQ